ncbi:CAMK family protein kinase [Histomonas meleagridis]|uniref:CAMK family protein kinase n=1 Tax=Histomonas meleagridis TaxID=135588 RepID=UPI0035593A41|nr:CAMK family protein kinase [Histomonas meleagridis]KAH0796419.1 CAMK family protein kinase [Histomonas meleagridis]
MQLVTVLQYLHHDAMVAHRDLKLENILLDKYNNIKLIDFGFSKSFAESHQFTSLIGSPAYVSPEIITRKTYSEKTDIWSLGIILYVMTTGTFPFNGTTTQMQMQRIAFVDPFIPHYLSHELRVLLKGMLTKDFTNRITLDEILDSKWLQGYKESSEAVTKLHNNLTNGIDKQIVEYMKSLSLDCEQLNENWINVTNSKVVAIYKIILCSKISRIVATELNKHKENNAQIQKHNFRSLTSYNRENREINDEQQQCVKVSKQGFLGKAKI